MVTEYALSSWIKTIIELDLLEYPLYSTTADLDNLKIDGFERAFGRYDSAGKLKKVKVLFKPTSISKLHPDYHP